MKNIRPLRACEIEIKTPGGASGAQLIPLGYMLPLSQERCFLNVNLA
jgi:hypothetical protein